ncbi:hypothetical protein [Sinomonas sp. G460-2]|uniref:hypothetical protein n=1 Tax=Sinomonas sp. G460-2 TaxID=3393464 RepID=UPI0039EE980F
MAGGLDIEIDSESREQRRCPLGVSPVGGRADPSQAMAATPTDGRGNKPGIVWVRPSESVIPSRLDRARVNIGGVPGGLDLAGHRAPFP